MAQLLVKFEPYDNSDDIDDYFERFQLFFTVNGVEEDKQVATYSVDWAQKLMQF